MSRHDFARDPCPWRLIEDMGGAYSMGLAGGAIWSSGKVSGVFCLTISVLSLAQSVVRREFQYIARNVRTNAPRTAAGFAVWELVLIILLTCLNNR